MPILYGLIGIGLLPIRLVISIDMARQTKVFLTLQILFVKFHWPLRMSQSWGTQILDLLSQGHSRSMSPIGPIIKILRRNLRFEDLTIQARVGLQDAAQTALLVAVLHAGFYVLGQRLAEPESKVHVRVMPDYKEPCFVLAGGLHVSGRVGLLAHAGALLLYENIQEKLRKQTKRMPAAKREG